MMKRILYSCVFFAGIYSSVAMAGSCPSISGPNPVLITPVSPISYSGPQDGVPHGETIGPGFTGEVTHNNYFKSCSSSVTLTSYVTPIKSPISGITYTDGTSSYEVYDTGVAGIGYAVGVKDPNAFDYIPMNSPTTQTFPAAGAPSPSGGQRLGFTTKVVFVATGHLPSGSFTIPAQTIATLSATQSDGQTNQAPLTISGVTINVTSTGCNVTSSNNATINLGDILPSAFTGVGSLAGSGSTTLSLQYDTGVQLWASMADSSNPANTTQTLSLTPDSVAQGVGIQFFANGSPTPVTFGPDSSSKGLPYSFFIDNSTGNGSIIEFPVVAKYIQTGRLAPGSANGIATVTFSYQ